MPQLPVKHRPRKFESVIGQDQVVKSLMRLVDNKEAQSFLFYGGAGLGKTTLARLAARRAGCLKANILEIDAATNTGIDAMRAIADSLHYKPIEGDCKAVIVDECHALTKQAWQSLLKIVEEPPENVYLFFCTTDFSKVPVTIRTRCAVYGLKPYSYPDLQKIVDRVVKLEKMTVDSEAMKVIIEEAQGSARQAVMNLSVAHAAKSRKEAAAILKAATKSDATIELCRLLVQGGSWRRAVGIIERMEDESPESVRIVVCNYIASVLSKAMEDKEACRLLTILEAFSTPYASYENRAPLLLSIGQALFNKG